jgi:hypothetical protein
MIRGLWFLFAGYAKLEVAEDSFSPDADDSSPVVDDNITQGKPLPTRNICFYRMSWQVQDDSVNLDVRAIVP